MAEGKPRPVVSETTKKIQLAGIAGSRPWGDQASPAKPEKTNKGDEPEGAGRARVLLLARNQLSVTVRPLLREHGYDVVGAMQVRAAIRALETCRTPFEAVITEAVPPDGDVRELAKAVTEHDPACRTCVIVADRDPKLLDVASAADAHLVLTEPLDTHELLRATGWTVAATRQWRAARGLEDERGAPPPPRKDLEAIPPPPHLDLRAMVDRLQHAAGLTPIQTVAAWRILWGDSYERMATLLGCTKRTVKYHVSFVLSKAGVSTRAELLKAVLKDAGLEDPWAELSRESEESEPE